jgi:hypothetical protein
MLAMSAITMFCTAGVAFYVRFLLALWKEIKPGLIAYWRLLRTGFEQKVTAVTPRPKLRPSRVALRRVEAALNATFEELGKDIV